MDSLEPIDVGEEMVKLSLECLAPLSYHPVIRQTIISIDVAVFVKLLKRHVNTRDATIRVLLLEITSSLVKEDDAVVARLLRLGLFDLIKQAVNFANEDKTARFCAITVCFASLAVNTKHAIRQALVDRKIHHDLNILLASNCDYAKFHAGLALAVLVNDPHLRPNITFTSPLADIFLRAYSEYDQAEEFRERFCKKCAFGIKNEILERINPLLRSDDGTVQAYGAFLLFQEIIARKQTQRFEPFKESIRAFEHCAALTQHAIARKLAEQCLTMLGEELPNKLVAPVHSWDNLDVVTWMRIHGFVDFTDVSSASLVDGKMLLLCTEDDLITVFGMTNKFHRKQFLTHLSKLKIRADYSHVDQSGINEWLGLIGEDFKQYTYNLVQAGVDRAFLTSITSDHLSKDCQITNGVHRTKILDAVKQDQAHPNRHDESVAEKSDKKDPLKVFVCSWQPGTLIASSICALLSARGLTLCSNWGMNYASTKGDIVEKQIRNIRGASHFILVLTPGCLDDIIQASEWEGNTYAKFIVAALQTGCNIIPVVAPGFKWPRPDTIHEDISPVCMMNGVKWKFGLQSQVIDRLDKFMTGMGSLQTLTNLSRATSIRSVQTNQSDVYVPAPPGATPVPLNRSVSNASMLSMESRASQRSYASSRGPKPPVPAKRPSRTSSRASNVSATQITPLGSQASLVSNSSSIQHNTGNDFRNYIKNFKTVNF